MTERWQVSEQGTFDVFEADGTWLGQVEIPENLRYSGYPTAPPVVIRGDTVWAVTRDDLGVNYVTQHVVAWPDRPSPSASTPTPHDAAEPGSG